MSRSTDRETLCPTGQCVDRDLYFSAEPIVCVCVYMDAEPFTTLI